MALTLRMLGGLKTPEIARAFLVSEATVGQRISRAKRTLADGGRAVRGAVRGRAAAAPGVGARGRLPDLQRGLLGDGRRRLDAAGADRGGAAARAHPGRPRAGRAGGARARRADGDPGLAPGGADRPGRRADPPRRPGSPPLGPAADPPRAGGARARRVASAAPVGPYYLQAAIAACHARASDAPRRPTGCGSPRSTRRSRGVAGSPVVELNRAVAVGMAFGPELGLQSVDALAAEGALDGYHLLPSVRGDLLAKLGRWAEAQAEFERAAAMTQNSRERELLLARAAGGGEAVSGAKHREDPRPRAPISTTWSSRSKTSRPQPWCSRTRRIDRAERPRRPRAAPLAGGVASSASDGTCPWCGLRGFVAVDVAAHGVAHALARSLQRARAVGHGGRRVVDGLLGRPGAAGALGLLGDRGR